MSSNFDLAMDLVLLHEGPNGEFTNDPVDAGGATRWGITQIALSSYYQKHFGKSATVDDVRTLPKETAKAVYKEDYWDKLSLDNVVDQKLSAVIMDQCVLRGVGHMAPLLQQLVGVKQDSQIGPITVAAINAANPKNLCLDIIHKEIIGYVKIVKGNSTQIRFLEGWEERMCSLLNYAFRV